MESWARIFFIFLPNSWNTKNRYICQRFGGKMKNIPCFKKSEFVYFSNFFTQNIFVKLHNIRIPNPSLINNNMSSLQMICIGICRVIHYRVRNSKSNFEIPAFFDVWIRNFKSGKFQTSSFKFQIVGEDLKVIIFVPYPIIYNPG